MIGIDTNVLVRCIVRDDAQQSVKAAELFERRVHRLKGLPEDVLEAIEAAKMDFEHRHRHRCVPHGLYLGRSRPVHRTDCACRVKHAGIPCEMRLIPSNSAASIC